MSQQQVVEKKKDEHDEHDIVMPGFRFHPTEEELIEFYLRRKVEGKRFHVELVTFLDLYRYDPWELPAMAAIGEKEWFFYVPRDRKYRNGDRPNRVTTSGYWKATGADRTIKTEDLRTIGLRKTLVFYSGKAPKGVRSSWIMNEYRLPTHETERLQTAEISLCRVYKRTVVIEDHSSSSSSLPRSLPAKAASSTSSSPRTAAAFKKSKNDAQNQESSAMERFQTYTYNATNPHQVMEEKQMSIFPNPCFVSSSQNVTDDLHRLVNFQHHPADHLLPSSQPQLHSHNPLSLGMLTGSFQAALSDRIWDWSSVTNDFHTSFK